MTLAARTAYQGDEREAMKDLDPEFTAQLEDEFPCQGCRCSDSLGCEEGCGWASPLLCTACANDGVVMIAVDRDMGAGSPRRSQTSTTAICVRRGSGRSPRSPRWRAPSAARRRPGIVEMSGGDDIAVYDGLKLLPAAIALLGGAHPHDSGAAVTVERMDDRFDLYTINWTRLMNPQRSSTDIALARIARSLIERDAPVELWDTCHFGSGTWQHVLAALER